MITPAHNKPEGPGKGEPRTGLTKAPASIEPTPTVLTPPPTDLTQHPAIGQPVEVADLNQFNTRTFDKGALADMNDRLFKMRASDSANKVLAALDIDHSADAKKGNAFLRDAEIAHYTGPGGVAKADAELATAGRQLGFPGTKLAYSGPQLLVHDAPDMKRDGKPLVEKQLVV